MKDKYNIIAGMINLIFCGYYESILQNAEKKKKPDLTVQEILFFSPVIK